MCIINMLNIYFLMLFLKNMARFGYLKTLYLTKRYKLNMLKIGKGFVSYNDTFKFGVRR